MTATVTAQTPARTSLSPGISPIFPLLALLGCGGEGTWVTETWGEGYIEEGIPAADFADGCAVTFDTFVVVVSERRLLDGDEATAGEIVGAQAFDMVVPGPADMGSATVRSGPYDTALFRIAPAADATPGTATDAQIAALGGASVRASGTLVCPVGGTVTFDWSFDTDTTYLCEPDDLNVPAGGEDLTQLTVHGDHLFYDGLENEDAAVRGEAIAQADADGDGAVTQAELAAVSVADLGYRVGQYSEVTDLGAFVGFLTQTLGHVDGEGHCQVDL